MKFVTYKCDSCNAAMKEPYNIMMLGRIDYDLCTPCYHKIYDMVKQKEQKK